MPLKSHFQSLFPIKCAFFSLKNEDLNEDLNGTFRFSIAKNEDLNEDLTVDLNPIFALKTAFRNVQKRKNGSLTVQNKSENRSTLNK